MKMRHSYSQSIIIGLAALFVAALFILKDGPTVAAPPASKLADNNSFFTTYLPLLEIDNSVQADATCNPTGGSGGLAPGRHNTTVAGLNAVVVVGPKYKSSTPTYLAFLLHGDGGDYRTQFLKSSNEITQLVEARNWVFVIPQSPNGGDAWWTNMNGDHVAKFAKVLDAMFAKYNVCRNVVFGAGGSGGAEFWTSQFFPNKGGTYPAHTVVACGGNDGNSTARQKIKTLGQNSTVVSRSSFYYVYGTKDRLVPGILESISVYRNAGFRVYVDKLEGAGHCNVWKSQGFPGWYAQVATKWGILAGKVGVK